MDIKMFRDTCGNCGAKLVTEFDKFFFHKHQQCTACSNPTLVQSRTEELQAEMEATPIPEDETPVVDETGKDEEQTPSAEEQTAPTTEVEMETITIKLSENPAIAEVYEKEGIEHDGDEVEITVPKTDLKLSDTVMAEIVKEQSKIKDAEIVTE